MSAMTRRQVSGSVSTSTKPSEAYEPTDKEQLNVPVNVHLTDSDDDPTSDESFDDDASDENDANDYRKLMGVHVADSSLSESSSDVELANVNEDDDSIVENVSITNKQDYKDQELKQKLLNSQERFEQAPWHIAILVYMAMAIIVIFGYFRDFLRSVGLETNLSGQELEKQRDFVPLLTDFEAMYLRNVYIRVRDSFEVPICSAPAAEMDLLDRFTDNYNWSFKFTGAKTRVINLGSYNYLGFAETEGYCANRVVRAIENAGLSTGSSRAEIGMTTLHAEVESLTAEFMGVEAAICTPMGFATNSMNIPCLAGKGCLILSDELNHASLVLGCKLTGATVRVFKHNTPRDLERKLRLALVDGQPRTHKAYKKILIIVEGIYSMEGSICKLHEIVEIKKKYKAYLFVDEAHSIGALGATGRGVTEYWGVDPQDVDILMGTFTKSFAAAGGYIAGSKKLIDYIKCNSHNSAYGCTFSAPVAQQILSSMKVIMGKDGTNDGQRRVDQLARNAHYFRERLKQLGFIVYGNRDSPVVPIMAYFNSTISHFSRQCRKRHLGVVVAGFPATALPAARARFCLSSAHTKEVLDKALDIIDEAGALSGMKHSRYKYKRGQEIPYKEIN